MAEQRPGGLQLSEEENERIKFFAEYLEAEVLCSSCGYYSLDLCG